MKETSARLLRLLSLLQERRAWSGAELAERLGITTRTVRRDVDKLRDLEYPVESAKGIDGGYRLGAGAELPPLLLDDEEAVALAIALRTATGSSVTGVGEGSLCALVKLEQMLPSRLRHRVAAIQVSTVPVPGEEYRVDADVLTAVAGACRDRQRLRFDYAKAGGPDDAVREVEPHELVTWGRRWYLVGWDAQRDDWRTYRVDRMRPRVPLGARFTPRPLPAEDAASFVAQRVAGLWPYQATLRLHVPADSGVARECATYGRIEPVDGQSCLLHLGAENPRGLAFLLSALEVDFDVVTGPGLAEQLRLVADRFHRALPRS